MATCHLQPAHLNIHLFAPMTKSSKLRREMINSEIDHLRTLLPLRETSLQRLSQLEVMSMACIFIRRCQYLGPNFAHEISDLNPCLQALPGFFLVCTADGKLVYTSNNITEFLGHSTIDITKQGDTIYDIVDQADHASVRSELSNWTTDRISFKCRISLTRYTRRQPSFFDEKWVEMSGYFTYSTDNSPPVFISICTPILSPAVKSNVLSRLSTCFTSAHALDMKFLEASLLAQDYLGVTTEELEGRSWYEFIHPEHLNSAAQHHKEALEAGVDALTIFDGDIMRSDGMVLPAIFCLQVYQHPTESQRVIICTTQIIDMGDQHRKPYGNDTSELERTRSRQDLNITDTNYPYTSRGVATPEKAATTDQQSDYIPDFYPQNLSTNLLMCQTLSSRGLTSMMPLGSGMLQSQKIPRSYIKTSGSNEYSHTQHQTEGTDQNYTYHELETKQPSSYPGSFDNGYSRPAMCGSALSNTYWRPGAVAYTMPIGGYPALSTSSLGLGLTAWSS